MKHLQKKWQKQKQTGLTRVVPRSKTFKAPLPYPLRKYHNNNNIIINITSKVKQNLKQLA